MRSVLTLRLALALAFLAAAALPAVRADEKEDLKKEILALKDKSGDDWTQSKAIELVKNKAHLKKLLKQADDMAKLDSSQFSFNSAYVLALCATQLKDYDVAKHLLGVCTKQADERKSPTKMLQAFELEYAIDFDTKNYDAAVKLCEKVLDADWNGQLESVKNSVREALIKAMTREGKVNEALKMTDELIKKGDFGWTFLDVKAWVLHEAGRDEEAVGAYLEFIDKLENNEDIKPEAQERFVDRTRYLLSNVYIELGQVDKAAEMLKALLQKKPDNSTYNNDLGFVWADHDMHLDEAEKMIRKAIELDRKARAEQKEKGELLPEDDHDNAAYVDSLGWVLFKKKQYPEAKKLLLEAVKDKEGQHIEILDHLADVQMAMGEKADAIATWKKALDQDLSTKRDLKRREDIIKKIKAAQDKK
jgi:tetratricopeptide (TPR) repeat protein